MSSEAEREREREEREREEREEIMVARPNKFYALKRQLLIAAAAVATASDGTMPRFRHLFLKKNDSYFCIYYSRQKKSAREKNGLEILLNNFNVMAGIEFSKPKLFIYLGSSSITVSLSFTLSLSLSLNIYLSLSHTLSLSSLFPLSVV